MKRRLLIIDDESAHSRFLKWILEDELYQVFTTNSCEEAVNFLSKDLVDLILLDLIMPDADGFEMLNFLKTNENLRKIPVIIVSAKNDRETIETSLRKGAIDYIVKPYNSEVLRNKTAIILKTDLTTKEETD